MAEPVSALPNSTAPTTTTKGQTVPWPNPPEPLPSSSEISGSNTGTVEFPERLGAGVQDHYGRVQRALSGMIERSRRRFQHMAQERPMRIVVGVAIISLLAGAALRIWRSHHD